jgi:hypothetical protein
MITFLVRHATRVTPVDRRTLRLEWKWWAKPFVYLLVWLDGKQHAGR